MKIDLYKGDCLEVMDELIAKGVVVDAIITDPPYGTTACSWDSVLPMEWYIKIFDKNKIIEMTETEFFMFLFKKGYSWTFAKTYYEYNRSAGIWKRLNKLIKPNGAIVLFGSEPFSSALRMSNIKNYKYDWVWEKPTATGHLNAKKQPMRAYENIMVFYGNQPTYNYQKTQGHERKVSSAESKANCKETEVYGKHGLTSYDSTERYPRNVIVFPTDKQKSKLHPTQKPVALMEYIIKTYTNEGELVLDFTAGSGTTPVACDNTGRDCIAIENNDGYFDVMTDRVTENKKRIKDIVVDKGLFDANN